MNRSRLVFFVCSSLLVLPLLMALVLAADPARLAAGRLAATRSREARGADHSEPDSFDTYLKYLKVFSEVLGLIRDTYVDEPNTEALMNGALEGVTDAMDPFSVYVPASAVAGYSRALAAGKSLSGLALLKEHGATLVMSVEKGSPADEAGLHVGDLVAKLNGTSTRNLPLWQMQEALAGAPGSKIAMELIRLGAPVQASIELKPFTPPAVSVSDVGEDGAPATPAPDRRVKTSTVLRIPTFGADTPFQVRRALGSRGDAGHGRLIVDLRAVSLGDPEVAYEVAKLFANGDLGALMRRKQEVRNFAGGTAPLWQGHLVVLVDRGTAGPAEVLATVLHQRAGAALVGERTLGYAGHQATADLSSGSRLFFTDAFYTGPDRKPINESLKPDVLVSERTRTFLEKDVPMSDLILRRGVHRLLDDTEAPARHAA
jgi:carboxyl-terminal processing protease